MGFTCLQSWSYAELLLAVASYLLFRHEGGILLIHLTARKKMKCISQNISNSAAHSSLPTRRNANAFPHVLTDSVHEFVFWHKIFLLFDKVSLLPCLVQLTQCRLHLFFFFLECLVWETSLRQRIWSVSAFIEERKSTTRCYKVLFKKDLLLPFRCTLKSSASPHYIVRVWSTIGGAYGIYQCDIQDGGLGRYLAGTWLWLK